MKTAQEFLTEFTKELVKHPMERQEIIVEWAKKLEAREQEVKEKK